MMMRKRTNRCRNTVWDISVISRNKNGETLCGDQCALEWDDNDATVILSDGLGSGVKANILSTLTTTMLTTMLKGNVPIDECVTTVAETLPMCRERKLAYATFTILQTAGTRARLIQYDNPNAVFVHNGAIGKYNYSVNFIQEKELHESYLHFDVGDMLVLFSDGVSEAGRGVTTDAGWARQDIEDFILRNYTPNVSAQRVAASILSTVKTLDMDAMHDDTTVVVARLRERCPVNVMIGPPERKDDDLSTMRLFFGKDGKHVVCGGYQMLGSYYRTWDGKQCDFIGAIDYYTVGSKERMIGNFLFECLPESGGSTVVGFENHSGKTYLGSGVSPLGKVLVGGGNNGEDGFEGVRYHNVFGTYSHGPVLPKNPAFCDHLLTTALQQRYPEQELAPLDDAAELAAHNTMRDRLLKK